MIRIGDSEVSDKLHSGPTHSGSEPQSKPHAGLNGATRERHGHPTKRRVGPKGVEWGHPRMPRTPNETACPSEGEGRLGRHGGTSTRCHLNYRKDYQRPLILSYTLINRQS